MTTLTETIEDAMVDGFETVHETKVINGETKIYVTPIGEYRVLNDTIGDFFYTDTEPPFSSIRTRTVYKKDGVKIEEILYITGTSATSVFLDL
ncbi:hypothetical protein [Anaerospora sp.]|uniref:hypothetical protein n=1 Tax=Anaerospora sp. TaxID=1960278 RepID=UPI00289E70D7|nr:hypothetical protein [Anaerospora sp.]